MEPSCTTPSLTAIRAMVCTTHHRENEGEGKKRERIEPPAKLS